MRTKLAYIAKSATEGVWFWSTARAEIEPGHRILLLYRFNRAAAKAGAEFGEAVLCGAKHYFSFARRWVHTAPAEHHEAVVAAHASVPPYHVGNVGSDMVVTIPL